MPIMASCWPGRPGAADGIDVLAIMTPNDTHYPIARDALASGLDVICDKPLATNLEDALDLVRRVKESGLVFCLTHNYTGYPMVRHARAMVQRGELGPIRQLHVEYIQGNLAAPTEADRDPAANWRFVGRAVRRVPGARRHRHPRPPSGLLHHRARAERGRGRARQRHARTAGARLWAPPAALRGWRARLDVGDQFGSRRRARAAHPRVRRQGRAGVASGGAEPPAAPAARRFCPGADARPPRAVRSRPSARRASCSGTRKASTRRSPTCTPMPPRPSSPGGPAPSQTRSRSTFRPWRTARAGSSSSKPRSLRMLNGGRWTEALLALP